MDNRNLTEHFMTLARMLAEIKAEIKYLATQRYVDEKNANHAAECPAVKKYAWLGPIAALLSGLGFLGGVIFSQLN